MSSEKMKQSEKTTFIKNFDKVFSADGLNIGASIIANVNPAVVSFLGDHGLVSAFAINNVTKSAELIYGIRCSIVHNKESDYHLTVSFYEDFTPIIPLMHSLVKTLEKLIVEKIKTNHLQIKYPQREMNLF